MVPERHSHAGSCSGLPQSSFSGVGSVTKGDATLVYLTHNGRGVVQPFYKAREVSFKAFVKSEKAQRDGLAVDCFYPQFKLSAHSRVHLSLRLIPGVCTYWSGAQTQK